jgi:hypothetical protein
MRQNLLLMYIILILFVCLFTSYHEYFIHCLQVNLKLWYSLFQISWSLVLKRIALILIPLRYAFQYQSNTNFLLFKCFSVYSYLCFEYYHNYSTLLESHNICFICPRRCYIRHTLNTPWSLQFVQDS